MSARTRIEELLRPIGRELDLALELDADGACGLEYGLGHELLFQAVDEPPGLMLASLLSATEPRDPGRFYRELLALNLEHLTARGYALALSREDGMVLLQAHRPLAVLDEATLRALVIDVAETADWARARIFDAATAADPGDGAGKHAREAPGTGPGTVGPSFV